MPEIYLIRHTTPSVDKGICYGQSDIDVTNSFREEASVIRTFIPRQIDEVYSSPLLRCKKLAEYLFPENDIVEEKDLMEIHCGEWEMKKWDTIPKEEIDPWMNDFVRVSIPGGESYIDLYARVTRCFDKIVEKNSGAAIITHGGVIRSILSHITKTPLIDSFKIFSLHYGCVICITAVDNSLLHEILFNRDPGEREIHKPSGFYKNQELP